MGGGGGGRGDGARPPMNVVVKGTRVSCERPVATCVFLSFDPIHPIENSLKKQKPCTKV